MKFTLLLFLTIVGSILGALIAPESPIYPFIATKVDTAKIHVSEIIIALIIAVFAAAFSIFGKYALKLNYSHTYLAVILSGLLVSSIQSFRFGEFITSSYKIFTIYLVATCFLIFVTSIATAALRTATKQTT